MSRLVVILGYGYTGNVLARLIRQSGDVVVATTRNQPPFPAGAGAVPLIQFDLNRPESWQNLPTCDGIVWTFPAAPLAQVRSLWSKVSPLTRSLVVIGTTSSYMATREGAETDEQAPLDRSNPRVEGEEFLRAEGSTVLRSAGIYGQGRNPLDWLRRGSLPGPEKIVNLVHVEDLAISILAALEGRGRGEDFIVSDGSPKPWGEIARWAVARGYVPDVRWSGVPAAASRRLSNRKLLTTLSPELRHTDLFQELDTLERPGQPSSQETSPAP